MKRWTFLQIASLMGMVAGALQIVGCFLPCRFAYGVDWTVTSDGWPQPVEGSKMSLRFTNSYWSMMMQSVRTSQVSTFELLLIGLFLFTILMPLVMAIFGFLKKRWLVTDVTRTIISFWGLLFWGYSTTQLIRPVQVFPGPIYDYVPGPGIWLILAGYLLSCSFGIVGNAFYQPKVPMETRASTPHEQLIPRTRASTHLLRRMRWRRNGFGGNASIGIPSTVRKRVEEEY